MPCRTGELLPEPPHAYLALELFAALPARLLAEQATDPDASAGKENDPSFTIWVLLQLRPQVLTPLLEDAEGPDGKKSNTAAAAHKTGRFEAAGGEMARIFLTARNWTWEHGSGGDAALGSFQGCVQDAEASRSASAGLPAVPC